MIFNDQDNEFNESADEVVNNVLTASGLVNNRSEKLLKDVVNIMNEATLWKTLVESDIFTSGSTDEIRAVVNEKLRQFAGRELAKLFKLNQEEPTSDLVKVNDSKKEVLNDLLSMDKSQILAMKALTNKVLKRNVGDGLLETNASNPEINSSVSDTSTSISTPPSPTVNNFQADPGTVVRKGSSSSKRKTRQTRSSTAQDSTVTKPKEFIDPSAMNGVTIGVAHGMNTPQSQQSNNIANALLKTLVGQGGTVTLSDDNIQGEDINERY